LFVVAKWVCWCRTMGEVFVNVVDLTGKSWNRLLPWVQESADWMRGLWDAKSGILAA
jgi:hypothetical protein